MAARKPSAPAVDLRSGPGGGTPCHRSTLHTRPRRRPTRPPPRREIKLVAGGRGEGPGAAPAPARGSAAAQGCPGAEGDASESRSGEDARGPAWGRLPRALRRVAASPPLRLAAAAPKPPSL